MTDHLGTTPPERSGPRDLDQPRADVTEALARPWLFEVDPDVAQPGSLEARAALAFKVLAAVDGFAIVLALIPPNPPVATFLTAAFNIAAVLLVALLVVEAVGIDRGHPWALAAIRPVLVLVAIAGVALVVMALASSRIRVPFDVAIAAWVLLARPSLRRVPRPDRRTVALTFGVLLALTGMVLSKPLFDWGGAFDVHAADIHPTITVDCGDDTEEAGLPATIEVDVDWTWSSTSLLPSGADVVLLGWNGDDANGTPLYTIDEIPVPPAGIQPGVRAYPSADMAKDAATSTRSHWFWGVFLAQHGFKPGHIDLGLTRWVDAPPDPQPLVFSASYIHAGVWRQDAAEVTCGW